LDNKKTTIIFLAMEFAPANTTGNYRSLKFVKYLNLFGIEPIVVTFKEEQAANFFNVKLDYKLLDQIPDNTSIYRINCNELATKGSRLRTFFRMFFRIDEGLARRWRKNIINSLDVIIDKHKPKLIFASLPPFSTGRLAVEISKKYRLPLVIDMRDLWSMWGGTLYMSRVHFLLTSFVEWKVLKHASAVIAVTPQLINQFRLSHPSLSYKKFHLIPNGFDLPIDSIEDFQFLAGKKKIVIGYVGSFYYNPAARTNSFKSWWQRDGHKMFQYSPIKEDWLYRSPYFFFKTIKRLFERYPEFKSIIEIHFVGHKPEWFDSMVNDFGIHDRVVSHGFVSSSQATAIQESFDLILATSEKVFNSDHYCLPSKLFDYVGRDKPIIGFVTTGIQKDFIINSGLGIICDPDNDEESVSILNDLFVHGKVFSVQKTYLESFHRKKNTKKLALIFNEVKELKPTN